MFASINLSRRLCTLALLIVIIAAVDALSMNDMSIYFTCKGKGTDMEAYYGSRAGLVADCASKSTPPCLYQCMYHGLGVLDEETGEYREEGAKNLYSHSNLDDSMKAKVVALYEKCYGGGKKFFNTATCDSFRPAFYCHYNDYNKLCGSGRKFKDINLASEEGAMENEMGSRSIGAGGITAKAKA